MILNPIFFGIFMEINLINNNSHHKNITISSITLTQNGMTNISVENSSPKFIWMEGKMTLRITSNITANIICRLKDSNGGKDFKEVSNNEELEGKGKTQKIILTIKPKFTTITGRFEFNLTVTNLGNDDQYSEKIEIILGMGNLLLIAFFSEFGIAIIIVLVKSKGIGKEEASFVASVTQVTPRSSSLPAGKIKCPECDKLIDEGLTFCPECGKRIPEFLRYQPNP